MKLRYKDQGGYALNGIYAQLSHEEQRKALHELRCLNGEDVSLPERRPCFGDSVRSTHPGRSS